MRPTPFIVQKPTPGTSRRAGACHPVGALQMRVRRPASRNHRGVSYHPARLPHTPPPGPDSVGPPCAKCHCLGGVLLELRWSSHSAGKTISNTSGRRRLHGFTRHTPRLHATGTDGCASTYVSGTLSVGEA